MKEQLISFETAKLAKEKGFWIASYKCYNKTGFLNDTCNDEAVSFKYDYRTLPSNDKYLAPTQSLLQAWLREEHNIIVNLIPYEDEIPECEGDIRQTLWEDETIDCREIPWLRDITTHTYYHSYEEALENALVEGLKLITK